MKAVQICMIIILLMNLASPMVSASHDSLSFELKYEVHKNYPSISILKINIAETLTLLDLNKYYKPSWVRKYKSVHISAECNGVVENAISKNDTLTLQQKDLMKRADVDSHVSVIVHYIPENNLKENKVKTINFSLSFDPDVQAEFIGGQEALNNYLKVNAIDRLNKCTFRKYHMFGFTFNIDVDGKVIDAQLSTYSEDAEVEELLLEAICQMPNWKPAEYANGTKTKEEFVFFVGDMQSCNINLFNTTKYALED